MHIYRSWRQFFVLAAAASALLTASAANAAPAPAANPLGAIVDSVAGSQVIQVAGCHANKQFHMVFAWGHPAWHRHGAGCQPIPALGPVPGVHCHANWQKHAHPGHGSKWHRHAAGNCHWTQGFVGGGPGGGCVKIGSVWICAAP
jgi:hypothetical protein